MLWLQTLLYTDCIFSRYGHWEFNLKSSERITVNVRNSFTKVHGYSLTKLSETNWGSIMLPA